MVVWYWIFCPGPLVMLVQLTVCPGPGAGQALPPGSVVTIVCLVDEVPQV